MTIVLALRDRERMTKTITAADTPPLVHRQLRFAIEALLRENLSDREVYDARVWSLVEVDARILPGRPVTTAPVRLVRFERVSDDASSHEVWKYQGSIILDSAAIKEDGGLPADVWLREQLGARCTSVTIGPRDGEVAEVTVLVH